MSEQDPVTAARAQLESLVADVRGTTGSVDELRKRVDDLSRVQQLALDGLRSRQEADWHQPTGQGIQEYMVDPADPAKGLRMVRGAGVVDIPELGIRNQTAELPGFLTDRPATPEHAEFIRAVEGYQWTRQIIGRAPTGSSLGNVARTFRALDKRTQDLIRATAQNGRNAACWGEHASRGFGDSSGSGAEWIADTFVPTLYRPFEVMTSEIDGIYTQIQVDGPVVLPSLQSGGLRPYKGDKLPSDDPATITPSTFTTSNETIDVSPLMVRYVMNATAAEDAAAFLGPVVQGEIMRAIRDGRADRFINGDSAATHQDAIASWNIRSRWGASGLGGSADHRRTTVAGARAHAYDATCTSDQSTTTTGLVDVILNTAALLGENAADELVVYLSPEKTLALLKDSRVVTVDAFGADASIKVGIKGLGAIFGTFRIVMTRWLEPTMAATGLYTGSSTYDSLVICSRTAWILVSRRGAVVETEVERKRNAIHVIGSSRQDMYHPGYSSTSKIAAVAFNI